jgi:hypothetical protein
MPGTTVLFASSPRAIGLAADSGGRIRPAGPGPDGHHLFRLAL